MVGANKRKSNQTSKGAVRPFVLLTRINFGVSVADVNVTDFISFATRGSLHVADVPSKCPVNINVG